MLLWTKEESQLTIVPAEWVSDARIVDFECEARYYRSTSPYVKFPPVYCSQGVFLLSCTK